MTYCKQTDGNLAALARYEREQDALEQAEDQTKEETEELMINASPTLDSVAFEAVTESDAAAEALCMIIREYEDNKPCLESNHVLVAKFMTAVREYCQDYVENKQ